MIKKVVECMVFQPKRTLALAIIMAGIMCLMFTWMLCELPTHLKVSDFLALSL